MQLASEDDGEASDKDPHPPSLSALQVCRFSARERAHVCVIRRFVESPGNHPHVLRCTNALEISRASHNKDLLLTGVGEKQRGNG